MFTNDLKKGDRVLLSYGEQDGDIVNNENLHNALISRENNNNGVQRLHPYTPWEAIVEDNMRGNTRCLRVFGWEEDVGSVYSHQILAVLKDGQWIPITHTPAQLKCKKMELL